MRILIADDDPNQRRLLGIHLSRAGHEVVEAVDGRAAWEAMQREHFRLVISDWTMPEVDGVELVRRIRAASFPGYTYILLLTALGDKQDVVVGLEAGADDYLTKPFNAGELRSRVAIGERILNLEMRLREMATRDALTGLFNRQAFDVRLADELRRTRRYQRPLSLILADLDYFKNYNDTNGHVRGDHLLNELAGVFLAAVRATDFVARYGGEEFAILLPEAPRAAACEVAERVRATVAAYPFPLRESQPGGCVTLSLGVASCLEDVAPEGNLVEVADQALYRAKKAGRNRVGLV
jgi:diguanylate cyclase (GGDEF)-like protein